jgi:hypothetical protein
VLRINRRKKRPVLPLHPDNIFCALRTFINVNE